MGVQVASFPNSSIPLSLMHPQRVDLGYDKFTTCYVTFNLATEDVDIVVSSIDTVNLDLFQLYAIFNDNGTLIWGQRGSPIFYELGFIPASIYFRASSGKTSFRNAPPF